MDENGDRMQADKEFSQKNYTAAEKLFTRILDNSPHTDLDILVKRSECFYQLGKYQDSFDDAQLFIEHRPDVTQGFFLCGRALTKLQKFEESLSVFKQGLNIDPNDPDLKQGLKEMQTDIIESYEKHEKESGEKSYNAVRMSSTEPYPGDDELDRLEKEILKKWGLLEIPVLNMSMQDEKKALKEFQGALQYRMAGNDEQVREKLQSAISHDAANFSLWGEAALVLYDMGDHRKAFQYCNIVPPEIRTTKVWVLGGKILEALDLPVQAEHWLRQACRLDKEDNEAPLLFQNIRVKRLYGPLTEGSKVAVKFTQFGRAVHATDDIKPGENCFRDKPVVLSQTLDTLHVAACAHCAKCLMTAEDYFGKELLSKNSDLRKVVQKHWPKRPRIPCQKCDKEMFCSVSCRDTAWDEYHQILCVSENPAVEKLWEVARQYANLTATDSRVWKGVWNASFSPFVLAKMWASIICLANNIAKQNGRSTPSQSDWTMAKSPYRKLAKRHAEPTSLWTVTEHHGLNGIFYQACRNIVKIFIAYGSSSNATSIPEMVTIMRDIFENLPEGKKYKITQREFDGRYFQATCNVQAFSDPRPPFNEFMSSIINDPKREMVRRFTMKDPDDAMFAGMFPLHACMNHSCFNNVEVLDGHPGVLVRAKLPIKKGDEIFTTYINTTLSRRERRAWLFRGYNFWCHCPRCNFEGDGPEVCTQCGKKATDDGKEKYPGCGKCHRAWYCSTGCQKTAWKKGHKKICN